MSKSRRSSLTPVALELSIATNPGHPGWPILEDLGLTLEKIHVLAELLANSEVGSGDNNVIADVIVDLLETAETQRCFAMDTLRRVHATS